MKPLIKTALPGPESKKWLSRQRKVLSPSYSISQRAAFKRGKGCFLEDMDGNMFLDCVAGYAAALTGHCHPDVVKAIQEQAENLIHISGTDWMYAPEVELAERLVDLVSLADENKQVYFANSGSEGVEAALKLARWKQYGKKDGKIIAFHRAFHGRTMASISLDGNNSQSRKRFFPTLPGVIHTPYAYCYRCVFNLEYPKCDMACVKYIEEELFNTITSPEEVSAIFVEPIIGQGGGIVPPSEFLQRLRELTKKHQILLIADEIQSGMGRSGKMLAIEYTGVKPDMVILSKGLASGLPISALIASMDWESGTHAGTFNGNPIACSSALATLNLVENGLMDNALEVGNFIIEQLKQFQKEYDFIGDVRGRGLMITVELVKDRNKKTPAPEYVKTIIDTCYENGLIIAGGGTFFRLLPSLVITKDEAQMALEIIKKGLEKI